MLNSVREKTSVVDVSRDASTVLAIRAAFVEREAGNLEARQFPSSSSYDLDDPLSSNSASIVKEEHINEHQPAAHGPNGIAGRTLGQRF